MRLECGLRPTKLHGLARLAEISLVLDTIVTWSLAYDITFGTGPVKANVRMDANHDESDPDFVVSALASLNTSVEATRSLRRRARAFRKRDTRQYR